MPVFVRWLIGLVVLGCVVVVLAYVATLAFGGEGGDRTATLPIPVTPALIKTGANVAIEGDCIACHTAPGGQNFAGGLAIATPIGAVYSTNITPDNATGIGSYSYGDFERAVRRGIRPDGKSLYPAMPFPSYARISDTDLQALYAYFMHGVQPVSRANTAAAIPWPLSMRWPLTYWRWVFAPAVQGTPAMADNAAMLARGAYLVEGLGHCGSCHTARGLGLEELALTPQGGPQYLAGGLVDNYTANDLRGDLLTGLGSWSQADIVQFLKSGRNAHSAAFGGMTQVVQDSTQYLSDADLAAIATFLKSLPATGNEHEFQPNPAVATALESGHVNSPGALVYVNNCASCHLTSGLGYADTFPRLAGNPVVNVGDPVSLIHLILVGGTVPSTIAQPAQFTMPAFAFRLTDQQIADVLTFIRSSWGNQAMAVDLGQVTKLRNSTSSPPPTLSP